MISVSQKIKVAVSHLMRTQMELDIEDYGLKGFGDLCNRILTHYADFPEPKATANDDALYKTVAPLQFSLNRSGESFANFANSKEIATAALCRHYFECYVNMPRGKRECFLFQENVSLLKKAIKERKNVHLSYREEHKNVAPCFFASLANLIRKSRSVLEPSSQLTPMVSAPSSYALSTAAVISLMTSSLVFRPLYLPWII